jgi:hypothetical protein
MFLLERVRVIRAPFIERKHDAIWIIGAIVVICGYPSIMGYEFIAPEADLSRIDGVCRIGIEPGGAIAMLVLDTVLNVVLTSIFVWQLRPAISTFFIRQSNRRQGTMGGQSSMAKLFHWEQQGLWSGRRSSSENSLRIMVLRNLIGSALILANTVVNNVIFLTRSFARMSHACLLMCLTDSKFDVASSTCCTANRGVSCRRDAHHPLVVDAVAHSAGRDRTTWLHSPQLDL